MRCGRFYDYGFRVVIAPSFGDIFFNNSFQNGLLPVMLPVERVAALRDCWTGGRASIAIDLAGQTVRAPDCIVDTFDVDPFRKECLLAGLDDIASRSPIATGSRPSKLSTIVGCRGSDGLPRSPEVKKNAQSRGPGALRLRHIQQGREERAGRPRRGRCGSL